MTKTKTEGAITLKVIPQEHLIAGFGVRRSLPTVRQRSVGPFVFFDHLGPDSSRRPLVNVPPHPHIGISTLTYLFEGSIRHKDSLGSDQLIEPGAVNWMHAGKGIVHSERSVMKAQKNPPPDRLHGAQFWIALPPQQEESDPFFRHYPAESLPIVSERGVTIRSLVGSPFKEKSPVETQGDLCLADIEMKVSAEIELESPLGHERALYLVSGTLLLNDEQLTAPLLIVLSENSKAHLFAQKEVRALYFGGPPLRERHYMDWNFVSSRRERLKEARVQYRAGLLGSIKRGGANMPHPEDAEKEPAPPEPNGNYLDRLMRRDSFGALWPLFSKATKPAKELTESFSALHHLRPLMRKVGPCRALHIGDGAHGRTAALFAIKSDAQNITIDPLINESLLEKWKVRFDISRFEYRKARIEDVIPALNQLPNLPTFLTLVHAHVNTEKVLASIRWDVAFILVCCMPGKQLVTSLPPLSAGKDMSVLSPERTYQVVVNPRSPHAHLFI